MSYYKYCWNCGAYLSSKPSKRLRLANKLEKEIKKKPYDDYICIDKKILWQVIDELRK